MQPKDDILTAQGDGYVIMLDSPWEQLPQLKDLQTDYLTVTLDVYCPGQSIFLREESPQNGYFLLEQAVMNVVNRRDKNTLDKIDKFPKQYG